MKRFTLQSPETQMYDENRVNYEYIIEFGTVGTQKDFESSIPSDPSEPSTAVHIVGLSLVADSKS